MLNALRSRESRQQVADNICKAIFFNENSFILIPILRKYNARAQLTIYQQIKAGLRKGDKPLFDGGRVRKYKIENM